MVKVRLQGTKKDIKTAIRLMNLKGVPLGDISKMFPNKGTNNYYRAYAHIQMQNVNK